MGPEIRKAAILSLSNCNIQNIQLKGQSFKKENGIFHSRIVSSEVKMKYSNARGICLSLCYLK